VTEFKDVFRLKLGAEPPANVKPLVIELCEGAEPVRMSARKYDPPQMKFMRDKIRELEELGLVYKNTGAERSNPPLKLSNLGPDQYRISICVYRTSQPSRQQGRCLTFKTSCMTCMAQKFLRRWIFVKAIGRYACTKIYKTVNRASRRIEYTHRCVYYMEQGTLRNI
jgi:hypothetical protein